MKTLVIVFVAHLAITPKKFAGVFAQEDMQGIVIYYHSLRYISWFHIKWKFNEKYLWYPSLLHIQPTLHPNIIHCGNGFSCRNLIIIEEVKEKVVFIQQSIHILQQYNFLLTMVINPATTRTIGNLIGMHITIGNISRHINVCLSLIYNILKIRSCL